MARNVADVRIRADDGRGYLTLDRRRFMAKLISIAGGGAAATVFPMLVGGDAAAEALTDDDGRPTAEEITFITPAQRDVLYGLPTTHPRGANIELGEGEFILDRTIGLPSNTTIRGQGDETRLVLAPDSNCHVFANANHRCGNSNITIGHLSVFGNGDRQHRLASHKATAFACGMYFKASENIDLHDLTFHDIRQTAMHFNSTVGVMVERAVCDRLGWSGASTSGSSSLYLSLKVTDAGRDVMHSAVHLDGGNGVYCVADVGTTTGNGIMLDSAYAPLSHVVVKGVARRCMRGVALVGSKKHALKNVFLSGDFSENRETGVMISNAANVTVCEATIRNNPQSGLLMQGKRGGRAVLVLDCDISGNGEDIAEVHGSRDNWIFSPTHGAGERPASNVRTLASTKHRGLSELCRN